jgi:hypothetical protein
MLNGIAVISLMLLIYRACIDIDLRNWDALAYHLPFAGRFWGLVPRDELLFVDHLEEVYKGFPLLGEILQGFFWRFFGVIQAANLVALISLVLFCYFAWTYLAVPAGMLFLALLAVPLIQIHAAASLVDLPTNVACAAMLLVVYRLYAYGTVPTWHDVAIFALTAGAAANMKFTTAPLVALAIVAFVAHLMICYFRNETATAAELPRRRTLLMMLALIAVSPIIFASLLKNTIVFGNPFYPYGMSVFGVTLPNTIVPGYQGPLYLREAPQFIRWGLSVLEFRAYDMRRPFLWTGEQGYLPDGVPADRMGGYFFVYVLFSLLLFLVLVTRTRSRPARTAGIFFLLLSVFTSLMPQSHELRYYMYWMIVLVALNFHLVVRSQADVSMWLQPHHLGTICCALLFTTVGLTKAVYVRPTTQATVVSYTATIEPMIEAAVKTHSNICVLGATNLFLLYTEDFHPSLRYSVKAAYVSQQCGSRFIVRIP